MMRVYIFILSTLPFLLQAQMTGMMGHFDQLPQNISANPAIDLEGHLHIGIPLLNHFYLGHRDNFLNSEEIFTIENGQAKVDVPQFLNSFEGDALTAQQFRWDALFIGWQKKKYYYHIRLSQRAHTIARVPKDLFRLAFYGNAGDYEFPNGRVDLSSLDFRGQHYSELVFGVQRALNDRIRLGINTKYLLGGNVFQTNISSLLLETDPMTYDLSGVAASQIYLGGMGNEGYQFSLTGNAGLGMDIGMTYHPSKQLHFQFSVMDLGWINWRKGIDRYETQQTELSFVGIAVTDFIFDASLDFGSEFNNRLDSTLMAIESEIDLEEGSGRLLTSLPSYFRFGMEYNLLEKGIHASKLYGNLIAGLGNDLIPIRISAGYIHSFWDQLQIGIQFSQQDWGPLNFGGGVSAQVGIFQLFMMVENVGVFQFDSFKNGQNGQSYFWPVRSDDLRLQLGFNLSFSGKDGDI